MRIKDICYIAIFTSFLCICSWIIIPFAIPFTLQTFAIFLAILVLGEKKGFVTIVLYLLIGLIGVPVFSGFNGGIGVLVGPTGGFIIGFIFIDLIYWLITYIFGKKLLAQITGLIIGVVTCYTFGCIFYIYVYGTSSSILSVLSLCVFPFILPDLVKLTLAFLIHKRTKEIIE